MEGRRDSEGLKTACLLSWQARSQGIPAWSWWPKQRLGVVKMSVGICVTICRWGRGERKAMAGGLLPSWGQDWIWKSGRVNV